MRGPGGAVTEQRRLATSVNRGDQAAIPRERRVARGVHTAMEPVEPPAA